MADDFEGWVWGVRYPDGRIELLSEPWAQFAREEGRTPGKEGEGQVVAIPPDGTEWLVMESEGAVAHGAFVERPAGWQPEEEPDEAVPRAGWPQLQAWIAEGPEQEGEET